MQGCWDVEIGHIMLSGRTGLVPLPHNLKIAAHICSTTPPLSTPSVPAKEKRSHVAEELAHTEHHKGLQGPAYGESRDTLHVKLVDVESIGLSVCRGRGKIFPTV